MLLIDDLLTNHWIMVLIAVWVCVGFCVLALILLWLKFSKQEEAEKW